MSVFPRCSPRSSSSRTSADPMRSATPGGDRESRHDGGLAPVLDGPDLCLVHNGSLSNHNTLRRALRREGIEFQTENDTEVAAGYLEWRLREGASLEEALEGASPTSTGSTPSRWGRPKALRFCATRLPASLQCWPRPTTGWRWRPSTTRLPCCLEPTMRDVGAGAGHRLRLGEGGRRVSATAEAEVVDLAVTPLRELNQRLHDVALTGQGPASGGLSTQGARMPSLAGWTPRSRSRSTAMSATTAPV